MKARIKTTIIKNFTVIAAGFIYYLIFKYLKVALPCIFNKLTGLLCPSCGISRMAAAAISGDFYISFGYNKLLFITLPLIAADYIFEEIKFILSGKRNLCKASKIFLYSEIILLVIFGILRNIL